MTHDEAKEIANLVRKLVSGYTRFRKALKFKATLMGSVLNLDVSADERDYPFLIGKGVQNLSAICRLCAAFGDFHQGRVLFNLARLPPPTSRQPPLPFIPDPQWTPYKMQTLLEETVENITDELPQFTMEHSDESTQIYLHLDSACADDFPRDVQLALGMVFHMIGKMEGRRVHMNFTSDETQATATHSG